MTADDLIYIATTANILLLAACFFGPVIRSGVILYFSLRIISDTFIEYESYDSYGESVFICLAIAFIYTLYCIYTYDKPFSNKKIGLHTVLKNLSGIKALFSYFYMTGVIASNPPYWSCVFSHKKFRKQALIAISTGTILQSLLGMILLPEFNFSAPPIMFFAHASFNFFSVLLTTLACYYFFVRKSPRIIKNKNYIKDFSILSLLFYFTLLASIGAIYSYTNTFTTITDNLLVINGVIMLTWVSKYYWKVTFLQSFGIHTIVLILFAFLFTIGFFIFGMFQ